VCESKATNGKYDIVVCESRLHDSDLGDCRWCHPELSHWCAKRTVQGR